MPWPFSPPSYRTSQSICISPCGCGATVVPPNGSTSSVSSPASDNAFSIVDVASIEEDGLRYIYYRLYAEDGPIPTAHPVYTNDPYLGRIPAEIVAPPHKAKDIKRCLSGIERIRDDANTNLFISTSQRTPIDDDRHVSISTHSGPGCVPHEPIALVAKYTGSGSRPLEGVTPAADRLSPTEGTTPFETQYIYYRVYNRSRAVAPRQPANSNYPWVGRLSVDSIPPPHTATSIMRCVSNAEQLVDLRHPQLYINTDSQSPIGDGHVSILTNNRPGSTPESPMAFVESFDYSPSPAIPRRMRVINVSPHSQRNRSWLNVVIGEILTTVEISPRQQPYRWYEGTFHTRAYTAVNAAGNEGFVSDSCVIFV